MADGGIPPATGGAGVVGIITAVGGVLTAILVPLAAILERRARAKARARQAGPTTEQIAEIARAVVLAEREAEAHARPAARRPAARKTTRPTKPAKGRRRT